MPSFAGFPQPCLAMEPSPLVNKDCVIHVHVCACLHSAGIETMNRGSLRLTPTYYESPLHSSLPVCVQALNNSMASSFYRSLADLSNGYHLHLDQFASIVDFLMAICFKEQSLDKLQVCPKMGGEKG